MNIGKAMKEMRELGQISRSQMAKDLGITESALWKIENGKTVPKGSTISRFCAKMIIPLAYLYHNSFEAEDFLEVPCQ